MVPNVVWSVLNLVPISIYCYNRMDHKSPLHIYRNKCYPRVFPKFILWQNPNRQNNPNL